MTTKNRPIRKKPKSFTPIVFKLTKEQQEAIKRPPRTSLNRFRANQADATDWYNIAFRIRVGVHLAKEEYAQSTVNDMCEAFTFCDVLHNRCKKPNGVDWSVTKQEADYIEDALNAVDIMQNETTRRIQLDAHHAAKRILKTYIENFNNYIEELKSCIIDT
jgi:hypothetical protein